MFADLYRRRELVWILVQRNLKIRYKHSALGFLWSLLTPLLMILMYAVFASILKFNTGSPNYLPFLVVGIVVWQFSAGCLNDSLASIAGSANLVKKVAFPRVILPISTVLANAVNFLLTFVVLVAYLLVTGVADFGAAQWLFAGFAMQLALGTGIACLCSTSNVFFRDTQHIVGIGSLAWFFLSPVFYGLDLQLGALKFAQPWLGGIVYLNPMSGILGAYRAGLMGLPPTVEVAPGVPSSTAWLLLSAAVCLIVLVAGAAAVRVGERHFGDVL